MRPTIGVSCNPHLSDEENRWKYRHYLQAIEAVEGIPMLIPSMKVFTRVQTELDGLIIPGGCDIYPSHYGEEPHPRLEQYNHALDELELSIVQWVFKYDIPTLGICRGMQLINVALGGTLYQDLADQYPNSLNHRVRNEKRCHRVRVQTGSRIEQLVGTQEFWVNSRHHQAVKNVGEGVCISGLADDNVVELFEVAGYRFLIGVQCHPEEIHTDVLACKLLFSALIQASSRNAPEKKLPQICCTD